VLADAIDAKQPEGRSLRIQKSSAESTPMDPSTVGGALCAVNVLARESARASSASRSLVIGVVEV
jgi:hypothetical protein